MTSHVRHQRPTGRNQICWDPKGYNAALLPGQAKVTLEEYQAVLMDMMTELLGGNYGNDLAEVWFDGGQVDLFEPIVLVRVVLQVA